MQKLTSPDFAYVGSEDVLSGQELAEATKSCALQKFRLSSPRLKILSSTSAMLTYTSDQEESCAGKQGPSRLFNVDVFVLRGSKWLVTSHLEAAASSESR
jgi:hypothetical protein